MIKSRNAIKKEVEKLREKMGLLKNQLSKCDPRSNTFQDISAQLVTIADDLSYLNSLAKQMEIKQ